MRQEFRQKDCKRRQIRVACLLLIEMLLSEAELNQQGDMVAPLYEDPADLQLRLVYLQGLCPTYRTFQLMHILYVRGLRSDGNALLQGCCVVQKVLSHLQLCEEGDCLLYNGFL